MKYFLYSRTKNQNFFSKRSSRFHSKAMATAERVAAITSEKGKAYRIPSTPHKVPKPIIAGIRVRI